MLDEELYRGKVAIFILLPGITILSGRVFYTGLGHTDESYNEPLFYSIAGRYQVCNGSKNKITRSVVNVRR